MSVRGRRRAGLVALACSLLAFPPAASGALDRGFSGDGRQTTDFGGGSDGASGMVLQPDGKIVVAGSSSGGDFALAR
jgi:hypothetical protein